MAGKTIREVEDQGFRVRIDLSTQVLRLSVPEEREWFEGEGERRKKEAPVSPTAAGADGGNFVSASILAQKAKAFDDGLYAASSTAA